MRDAHIERRLLAAGKKTEKQPHAKEELYRAATFPNRADVIL
jgi:hypothetical protein